MILSGIYIALFASSIYWLLHPYNAGVGEAVEVSTKQQLHVPLLFVTRPRRIKMFFFVDNSKQKPSIYKYML